jgi:hypothetical protein
VSEHTPGPWTAARLVEEDGEPTRGDAAKKYAADCIDKGGENFFIVWCEKPDGPADVCHTGNGPTSAENARLIAAAPDLLAFAERYVDEAEAGGGWEGDEDLFLCARAAIRKAEGK